jgi:hypothetical protein
MSLAEFSLKRPFTVATGIPLVRLLAADAGSRMAMYIFPRRIEALQRQLKALQRSAERPVVGSAFAPSFV